MFKFRKNRLVDVAKKQRRRLLAEARGKSRRQLQELIARWFPRPDVAPRLAFSFRR